MRSRLPHAPLFDEVIPVTTGFVRQWARSDLSQWYGGSWEECAKEAGVRCVRVQTDRGGALCVLYRGSLSRARLEEALAGSAEWFLWEKRRIYLPGNSLYKALEAVHRSRRAVTLKTLSYAAGVRVRRVRDWIRAMGEDVDSLAGVAGS